MEIVIIACAGGFTSSMFCDRLKKEAELKGISCEHTIAYDKRVLDDIKRCEEDGIDLLLIYSGAQILTMKEALEGLKGLKLAFVAPQMAYMMDEILKKTENYNIQVKAIKKEEFGMMKVENVLRTIEEIVFN